MNFNHLMDKRELKATCGKLNVSCYYVPRGPVRPMLGDNVHLTMVCKRCGKRRAAFLTKEEYFTHDKLIHKEIRDV